MVQYLRDTGIVFRALGDDTRRDILLRLKDGPRTVTALSSSYRMSLPALLKHLRVLETAGLVRTGKTGRVRSCALAPDGLRSAALWLSEYEDFWTDRLDALDTHLKENP